MTLMLDPEPTISADTVEDETQSLHAWSQEDAATEVVDYRQRSWKLPITLAVAAVVGMIGAAAYLEWPTHSAQPVAHTAPAPNAAKPQVAPKPLTKDERFLTLVQQRGITVVSKPLMLNAGPFVCTAESQGHTDPEIAEAFTQSTPGMDLKTANVFVDTAVEVYCPPGAK
jgi:hypothetical protein